MSFAIWFWFFPILSALKDKWLFQLTNSAIASDTLPTWFEKLLVKPDSARWLLENYWCYHNSIEQCPYIIWSWNKVAINLSFDLKEGEAFGVHGTKIG